ncbi:MAG TPA: hypothetical protein VG755_41905, partial [Nannocystaceae bacterium]|nr:hypothetical protein [Nannocystaceae bacterium]
TVALYDLDFGTITALGSTPAQAVADADLVAGDLDGNGTDELVVAWSGNGATLSWRRIDFVGGAPVVGAAQSIVASLNYSADRLIDAELGDTDGDHRDELVIASDQYIVGPGRRYDVYLVDELEAALPAAALTSGSSIGGVHQRPSLVVADLGNTQLSPLGVAADGREEIAIAYVDESWSPFTRIRILSAGAGALVDRGGGELQSGEAGNNFVTGQVGTTIAAADVDLDGAAEIVAAFTAVQAGNYGERYDLGARVATVQLAPLASTWFASEAQRIVLSSGRSSAIGRRPALALADVDADSLKVRATGEVRLISGPPHVNAVLIAPPTWRGDATIEQGTSSSTAYGTADMQGSSDEQQIGASASATLSFGGSVLDIVEAESTATLRVELATSQSHESSITYGSQTESGNADDVVVFRVTPYASHLYEVIGHPDSAQIGTLVSVDVPGHSVEHRWDRSSFIAEYGAEWLPTALWTHEIGNPRSYRDADECDEQALEARVPDANIAEIYATQPSGVGKLVGGSSSLFVTVAEQTGTSASVTLGVELTNGAKVVGLGLSRSIGISSTFTHEVVIGESVTYTGRVADLAPTSWNEDTFYEWGLCVYHYDGLHGSFPVVDYYVETIE